MTHRPIQPIAINGFEPGGTPRAYPIFEDVDPASLLVDEGYQRDSSERSLKLVRKIVSGWDVVEKLYTGYGESSGGGMRAGKQDAMFEGGNAWLDANFPKLDKLVSVRIVKP